VDGRAGPDGAGRGLRPGALLSAANPKNGGLTIAAAASIAAAGLAGGERAATTLDAWKAWAGAHNAAIMAVLFLVFGLKLVGDGIAVLF
jgi:hypothetical protein